MAVSMGRRFGGGRRRRTSLLAALLVLGLALPVAGDEAPPRDPHDDGARRPSVSLGAAAILVLEADAPLYDGPTSAATQTGLVPPWTPGRAFAMGRECHPHGEDLCSVRWSVETGAGNGWIDGHAILVRTGTLVILDDLVGGQWLDGRIDAADGSAVPRFGWYGVRMAWEWHPDRGRDHANFRGRLVVQTATGLRTVELGHHSGWGSAQRVLRAGWRDLDADGVAELLVEVAEDVTEVGYVGRRLLVLDDLEVRLDIAVGDPTLNGLAQDRFGAVRVEGPRIVHEVIAASACDPPVGAPPEPPTEGFATTCVTGSTTTWEGLDPVESPLALRADGHPIVAFHYWVTPVEEAPAPFVLVRTPDGPRWLRSPSFEPAWLGGTFGGERDDVTWVDLVSSDEAP